MTAREMNEPSTDRSTEKTDTNSFHMGPYFGKTKFHLRIQVLTSVNIKHVGGCNGM